MNDLSRRLHKAKMDHAELNQLITDYLPFIKKEMMRTPIFQMEFDDRLSLAMLTFMNCVRQYEENAGGFLPFAATCIHNRLIDEGKKLTRYKAKTIPLDTEANDNSDNIAANSKSIQIYEKEQERLALAEEIEVLSAALSEFGITLGSLAEICPKQNRSRKRCVACAQALVADPILQEQFPKTRRLPQAELAKRMQISEKTVEKHRRYIVVLTLILLGDYPGIQAFLPEGGD